MNSKRVLKKKEKRTVSPRAEAEGRLAQTAGAFPEIKEKTPEKLVHELQVHQIELEMQNEELRNAQFALEETRDKYIDLYDFAPLGYFTFSREALIKEVNLTGAALFGVERHKLINARFRRFVVPEDHEKWDRHLLIVFDPGGKQVCELKLRRDDGSLFYARLESKGLDESGEAAAFRTAMNDITERKQAEAERERLITEREDALANVKQLSGLLPICASCKKIRDDKGYWSQIESYITEHSEALFTHGICPDCYEKTMKEFEEIKKRNIKE